MIRSVSCHALCCAAPSCAALHCALCMYAWVFLGCIYVRVDGCLDKYMGFTKVSEPPQIVAFPLNKGTNKAPVISHTRICMLYACA